MLKLKALFCFAVLLIAAIGSCQTASPPAQTSIGIPVSLSGYWDVSAGPNKGKVIGALSTSVAYTPLGQHGFLFDVNPFVGETFSNGPSIGTGGASLAFGYDLGYVSPTLKGMVAAFDAGVAVFTAGHADLIGGFTVSGTLHF